MTKEDEIKYEKGDSCHICNKKYTDEDIRVRDHSRITEKYRGLAHHDCNLNFKLTLTVTLSCNTSVKNHTYKNKKGEECSFGINVIPNNMEKYMAFMLGNNLTFIDSFQFMSSSLDKLAKNLPGEYTEEEFKNERFFRLSENLSNLCFYQKNYQLVNLKQ